MRIRWTSRTRWVLVAAVLVAALGWYWSTSLVPSTYNVMSMGYEDLGGGPPAMAAMPDMPMTTSIASLTGPMTGAPDVDVTLVARRESFTLPTGQRVRGYTFNHASPGPTIRATVGDLVQVTLVNESVIEGVTIHWHGVDVPAAEDGVAGVTQDAVPVGGRFVYRFRVDDAGTYWYHSHQLSHVEIPGGLYGALVVEPRVPEIAHEVIAALHTYGKLRTINGATGLSRVDATPGETVRLRVIDTDIDTVVVRISGATFRLVAIDGRDVNKPTGLDGTSVVVAAGGRGDFEFTVPTGPAVLVDLANGARLAIGPPGAAPAPPDDGFGALDLLSYGSPAPIGFDPTHPDRRFTYAVGRRIGLLDGVPGDWWTVNGHIYPDIPMFEVAEGDVVVMTLTNTSGINHPMHLHGHHAVVLSRDGVAASGSPWWTDSLNVDGSTYVIAFVADNPGIWMDHCHNLPHAADGLISHLAYLGVSEPFQIGGPTHNQPE